MGTCGAILFRRYWKPSSVSPGNPVMAAVTDKVLKEVVPRVGKLPEPLWSDWEIRAVYLGQDGTSLDGIRSD
jgi:hypothetical protein